MHSIANRLYSFIVIVSLLAGTTCASAFAAGATGGANVTFTTLRAALKEGLVSMKVKGDGQTTAKVQLGLTNKTDHPLKIVVPANEILLSHSLSVQNMMVTQDRIVSIPAGGNLWADIPTMCVSTKSVKPPPGEEMAFTAGNYDDPAIWKQLASIVLAARQLNKSGAFDGTMFAKERREAIISQLAVWLLLGKKSAKPEDQVNAEIIGSDTLSMMGLKREQLSKEKQQMFDRGVDQIFLAVDLTLKKSAEPEVQKTASLPGDSRGITFSQVGARALEEGNFTEAEELLAAAVDEGAGNEKDPEFATSVYQLGQCYLMQGKPIEAQPYFQRAMNIREKVLGADYIETAEAMTGLAFCLKAQGKDKEAIALFERALAIREKSLGPNHTLVAESCSNLAMAYLAAERYDEAEKLLRRALLIRYKNLGPETPAVAETNKNLGDVYAKQGKYPLAEKSYKRALEIAQKSLGKDHPYICPIADGLAQCYRNMSRDADGDDLAKQSLTIKEKALGGNATLIAAVPQDYLSIERLAMFSSRSEKMEASVKELQGGNDRSVKVNAKEQANRPIKDKWALVIGISKFQDPAINLKYASKDAQDFAQFLVKEANFAPDHVHVLIDEKATRENILAEVGDRWLPRMANPDDLVLIYMSSHGSSSQSDIRGTNYLVAHNTDKNSLYATGIQMKDLASIVKDRVHSDRVVMLLDACHSGAVSTATKGLFRQTNFDADAVLQGSGQLVICSSEPSQTSWESNKYPNGVFTHYLIEGLRKNGDKTPLGSAFQYMKDKVQQEVLFDRGEPQTPVLKSRWEGNDLIIAVPPAEPRAAQ